MNAPRLDPPTRADGWPDLAEMSDGRRVGSPADWFEKRAPELRELFQEHMLGRLPEHSPVRVRVHRRDPTALEGKAILHELDLEVGLPGPIQLLLFLPAKASSPRPCFLGMNFGGNHTVTDDPLVRLPAGFVIPRFGTADGRADPGKRGFHRDRWSVRASLARGYAVATFYYGDVVPDDPKLGTERLRELWPASSSSEGGSTAAVMAWAWGLMRAIDYLSTRSDLDPARLAVVGHSRLGKAALVATAFDPRIALAIPSQSGCGGAAPSRLPPDLAGPGPDERTRVETLRALNDRFPHWFCPNFHRFNGHPEHLPFDQDALIALCAPRPVLLSNAEEDHWANPEGQFAMLRTADPLYRLVTESGLDASQMPPPGGLVSSRLGYFFRPGPHSTTPEDWAAWLRFADRWLC